jgi:hypothetical protein
MSVNPSLCLACQTCLSSHPDDPYPCYAGENSYGSFTAQAPCHPCRCADPTQCGLFIPPQPEPEKDDWAKAVMRSYGIEHYPSERIQVQETPFLIIGGVLLAIIIGYLLYLRRR